MAVAKTRLRPEDWIRAALDAIAESGISGVAVEALSLRVGASKGSFYWHFSDRGALIAAAMHVWEETRTNATIRELQAVDDPRERLQKLLANTFRNPAAARVELALALDSSHPAVGPVMRRVTSRRLAFLADAFGELGFSKPGARRRALAAYSMHLGLMTVREASRSAVRGRHGALHTYMSDLLDVVGPE
jgi:AcrR family transcriptional regulator